MTGIKEVMDADNGNVTDVEDVSSTTHDLTVEDITVKNADLDARLNSLAGIADDKTNTSATTSGTVQSGTVSSGTAQAKPGEIQNGGTVTQPITEQPRGGIGGWTGKAPRAYGARFNWDAAGNVIDKVSNTIIATAGAERKSFERMLPLISSATAEADKYKGMYESAEKANVTAAALKLTPEEYSVGARIMAAWKKDPKSALAYLLKEAQNNGLDVSDLGVAGGGLSRQDIVDTVKGLLEETIKPYSFLVQDRQAQIDNEEAYNGALGIVEEFMTANPDARIHADSLTKMMNSGPNGTIISLEEAYLRLQNHALKNGLDWTKDLVPQVQALIAKNGGTPANNQPANRKLPNLNGRMPNPEVITDKKPGSLGGNASTADIVKQAMLEAGMDISQL